VNEIWAAKPTEGESTQQYKKNRETLDGTPGGQKDLPPHAGEGSIPTQELSHLVQKNCAGSHENQKLSEKTWKY
jgi:hypothetical protein